MTGQGKRPLAAIVAVVLTAALIGGCGGSDSDSSSSTEATGGSTTAPATAQNGGGNQNEASEESLDRSRNDDQKQQGSGHGSQDQQGRSGGSGDGDVATPLEVSGGGAAQFEVKGGDNSIQEFGEDAESELQEVAEIVHGFFVARAEGKWDAACAYLAKSNVEQLEKLGRQSEPATSGCAPVLAAFTRPLPAAVNREVTTVDAGSFRREGEQGFLMYFGAGQIAYAMPLREEGGAWKVAALSGTTLS